MNIYAHLFIFLFVSPKNTRKASQKTFFLKKVLQKNEMYSMIYDSENYFCSLKGSSHEIINRSQKAIHRCLRVLRHFFLGIFADQRHPGRRRRRQGHQRAQRPDAFSLRLFPFRSGVFEKFSKDVKRDEKTAPLSHFCRGDNALPLVALQQKLLCNQWNSCVCIVHLDLLAGLFDLPLDRKKNS